MTDAMTLIAQISDYIKAHGRLSYKSGYACCATAGDRHAESAGAATGYGGNYRRPVDFGTAEEYQTLRKALRHLQLPFLLMPGNHDDRQQLRAAFPEHHYLQHGETLNWQMRESSAAAGARLQRTASAVGLRR